MTQQRRREVDPAVENLHDKRVTRRSLIRSGVHPRVDLEKLVRRSLRRNGAATGAELAALMAISDVVAAGTTPREVFPEVVAILGGALPLRAAILASADPVGAPLVWSAPSLGPDGVTASAIYALTTSRAVDDAEHGKLTRSEDGLLWISMPLVADPGDALGLFCVAPASDAIEEHSVAFVACVARTIGRMMRGERRADRLEAGRAAQALLFADLTALLAGNLDYVGALRQVTRTLGTHAASGCVVDIVHEHALHRLVHAPLHAEPALTRSLRPVVEAVLGRGAAVSTPADACAIAAATDLEMDWLIALPIRGEGPALGTVTLFGRDDGPHTLPLSDVEDLAQRAAAAIENGRRYEDALARVRVRDQVLSTVSHDLKNPLGVILLSTASLLEQSSAGRPSTERRQLESIQRCALRMRKLVGDLLDLAALDGRAMTMRPTHCSPLALVRDAIDMLAPLARNAGIDLVDDLVDGVPTVWVDADRIAQVLSNLIGNALKFTPKGGSVSCSADERDGYVEIAIRDTGVGMAADEVPLVFDRFWQGHNASRLGSGLGLAICKAIVEQSGGRIFVESTLGVGTTMSFTLPLASPQEA